MQQPPPVSTAVDGALSVRELLLGIQNSKFVIITISSVNMSCWSVSFGFVRFKYLKYFGMYKQYLNSIYIFWCSCLRSKCVYTTIWWVVRFCESFLFLISPHLLVRLWSREQVYILYFYSFVNNIFQLVSFLTEKKNPVSDMSQMIFRFNIL